MASLRTSSGAWTRCFWPTKNVQRSCCPVWSIASLLMTWVRSSHDTSQRSSTKVCKSVLEWTHFFQSWWSPNSWVFVDASRYVYDCQIREIFPGRLMWKHLWKRCLTPLLSQRRRWPLFRLAAPRLWVCFNFDQEDLKNPFAISFSKSHAPLSRLQPWSDLMLAYTELLEYCGIAYTCLFLLYCCDCLLNFSDIFLDSIPAFIRGLPVKRFLPTFVTGCFSHAIKITPVPWYL